MTIQNHLQNSGVVAENAKNSNIIEIGKILATAICRLHNKNLHQIEQKELDSNCLRSVHRLKY
jgi:NADPH-dependent 7-cyano-7-deazaguanine reductase QueF